MTWQPSGDIDREIRQWMKARGWEVNQLKVAAAIRRRPDARYVVVQNGPVAALAEQT